MGLLAETAEYLGPGDSSSGTSGHDPSARDTSRDRRRVRLVLAALVMAGAAAACGGDGDGAFSGATGGSGASAGDSSDLSSFGSSDEIAQVIDDVGLGCSSYNDFIDGLEDGEVDNGNCDDRDMIITVYTDGDGVDDSLEITREIKQQVCVGDSNNGDYLGEFAFAHGANWRALFSVDDYDVAAVSDALGGDTIVFSCDGEEMAETEA